MAVVAARTDRSLDRAVGPDKDPPASWSRGRPLRQPGRGARVGGGFLPSAGSERDLPEPRDEPSKRRPLGAAVALGFVPFRSGGS